MVQHCVDDDSSYGNEHPDWKCDFCEAFVGVPSLCEGVLEYSNGQKRNQRGKQDVGDQDRQVRCLPGSAAQKLLAVFTRVLPQLLVIQ